MKYGAPACTAVTLAEGPVQAAGGGTLCEAAIPLRRDPLTHQLTEEGATMRAGEMELKVNCASPRLVPRRAEVTAIAGIALEQTHRKHCTDKKLTPPPPPHCPETAIWLTRGF